MIVDKQQEVDINNLRLEEEFGAGASKSKVGDRSGSGGAGGGGSGGKSGGAPLSLISGVKKPLGHTNSFCGSTLPKYGVEPKLEHEPELAKVILDSLTLHSLLTMGFFLDFGKLGEMGSGHVPSRCHHRQENAHLYNLHNISGDQKIKPHFKVLYQLSHIFYRNEIC